MKLFFIPTKEDYHEDAGFVVMAETKEKAITIILKQYTNRGHDATVEFADEIQEISGPIYKNNGCDC
mgnify:FL=1